MKKCFLFYILLMLIVSVNATERQKLNFNGGWRLAVGDFAEAAKPDYDDSLWQQVTLPYAFNGDEAFRKDIVDLTDTVCWYRKTFILTEGEVQGKVFIEFEGARQGADVWLNGQKVGFSDNGVMAFGFDLTPYVKAGHNILAVRCDNNWKYRDRVLDSRYQWNDNNFNANYGGLPKNVFLHITDKLYQTLPLYSNLGTTGTYIYATDYDIPNHKATIHAESQVRNEDVKPRSFTFFAKVLDMDGKEVARFHGDRITMQPGETRTVRIQQSVNNLHFWSWGYGYLYMVETGLLVDGKTVDLVATRTGFRKTRFAEGKIWLNDRVMMVHGYAQRTSNEWPGVGISVPAWLSDYSNGMMVESGANMVRWMHVTPWKQDIESCDRVGLPQAMPAGDAEKDVDGARWQQRTALMRDAIIYNRNNPSILFYECGNESISREHMLEMKAIRNQYDPYGGRAIGSREMLDIDEAEYGGEMLYINKSKKHPMWAMEYCRDEGLRKYWDEQSYPFHKEGDGPLYRGKPANEYNHNMDEFAVEMVHRWYDYWRERPGTGTRVSSGGVKIVFSDTNTHHRGEKHYRTSGVVDAMRIPKDAFFAHQVMWNGWVEPEEAKTYIVGHWNYPAHTVEPVYVVSTADSVELFLNGKSLGKGKQNYRYLYTFDNVAYEPGTLEAVSSDSSRYKLETAGEPYQLKLSTIANPLGIKADGADMVLVQVEVTDKQGRRCPLDNRMIHFSLWGEARWIGGIETDAMSLPVECGVNRVLLRTTTNAGEINLAVYADGVKPAYVSLNSKKTDFVKSEKLSSQLDRGETPITPSYKEHARGIDIVSAKAGCDSEHAIRSYDDNELSEWKNDGQLSTAWINYQLARKAVVDDICLKLTGWRLRSYPIEVYAGKQLIWSGETERSLGYIHLTPTKRVKTNEITIRLKGAGKDKDAFGGITELAQPVAGELDLFKARNGGETKSELRIVEVEFIEQIK
nr:sugar-binding domain-containing protein [uncultured Prevotella sp.]